MKQSVEIHNNGKSTTTYEFHKRPEKQSLWKVVYDSSSGKVLGRTGFQWFQLIAFYVCFYTALGSIFYGGMHVLINTLDEFQPRCTLDGSLIGINPGMGFRPMPSRVQEGSLIWYNLSNKTQINEYVESLDKFLESYNDAKVLPNRGINQVICNYDSPPRPGQVCFNEVKYLAPCTADEGYGYSKSTPCVFLKLNRIYGWTPDFYDDINELPEDMPEDLVEHIKSLEPKKRRQVWVSCKGENPHDTETVGPIEYLEQRGYPEYFYPFLNTPGYLSPVIAVRFGRPAVNRLINVECRSWAKNIDYRSKVRDRSGSVHFELMIDAP